MAKISLSFSRTSEPVKGLFLAFQYPSEVPGRDDCEFLRAAVQARLPEGEELEATDYYANLYEKMDLLEIDRSFTSRAVNEGFSGGEKKRCEILQMAMLEPRYAVLDETDSGLDIDALKVVANGVEFAARAKPGRAFDHALSTFVELYRPRFCPCYGAWPHCAQRRKGTRAGIGGKRLRLDSRPRRGASGSVIINRDENRHFSRQYRSRQRRLSLRG